MFFPQPCKVLSKFLKNWSPSMSKPHWVCTCTWTFEGKQSEMVGLVLFFGLASCWYMFLICFLLLQLSCRGWIAANWLFEWWINIENTLASPRCHFMLLIEGMQGSKFNWSLSFDDTSIALHTPLKHPTWSVHIYARPLACLHSRWDTWTCDHVASVWYKIFCMDVFNFFCNLL